MKKPITNTYAELTYQKDGYLYEERGSFDDNYHLSGFSRRSINTDKGWHYSTG